VREKGGEEEGEEVRKKEGKGRSNCGAVNQFLQLTLLTLSWAPCKASFFFWSSSVISSAILDLSFSTICFFFNKSLY